MPDTTLFYASTLFGAMTLAAAIDEGRFRDGGRVLLVSNNAAIPEVTPALDEAPGFAALRDRFDRVLSWNEIIAPLHPSDWKPRSIETPMLGRLLRDLVGEPGELVLESIAVPPSRTLAGLVKDCPITVYSDGLMSYGPTRDPLPREIAGRITRLLHLDLVPGLAPLLLAEHGVPAEALADASFTSVTGRVAAAAEEAPRAEAVILGQYLSALGLITPAEEAALHERVLRGVAARGHRTVLFKPHPAAGRRHARELRPVAAELGVDLLVAPEATPAEACFAAHRPELVAGCFSTALVTARRLFGLPVAATGTDLVLERLTPYENSNRIPATIVDATLPRLEADGTLTEPPAADLTALVGAVGYCMQSAAHPGLRETAAAYVDAHGPARYFKKRRLESLGLIEPPLPPPAQSPAQPPAQPPAPPASRLRRLLTR
ncbi:MULTISPECIES: alpha-2,8-polysialyltransferase family protein [unclassified Microbispora]|uniref:alpha-2,8-polysialyltransferase family protein n=1 Tax=unclassified Microbispora TaxID=2614687 RepID=UPI0021AFBAE2|nr:alpha-2,8-polysialyltransferase family protein [Microbispora sp. SCL1-1]